MSLDFWMKLDNIMDMVDFDLVHEVEEDYNLNDLFPVPLSRSLQHTEYRIKLLLKN